MNQALYKVRLLLHDMEQEFGLSDLSPIERDVLYVIESLAIQSGDIATHLILSHELLRNASRPTIYRAFNVLIEKNHIQRSSTADRGVFRLATR